MGSMGSSLTGHVEPLRRDGKDVRGWWRLVVELPGEGRKRQVRTVKASGKKAAASLLRAWVQEIERRLACIVDPTIDELYASWEAVRLASSEKPWRPKTRKFHADNMRLHVSPSLGDRPARTVQPGELTQLYAELAKKGLGETSRHHVHATIRAMYNWGMRNEQVERNPALLLDEPPQQISTQKTVWTETEIELARREAAGVRGRKVQSPQLVYVPIVLGGWAGLRCGEMCGLRWAHVDFEGGGIHVQRGLSQTAGGELHDLEPKSKASIAFVPMPSQAMDELRAHKARQDEMRLAQGGGWNGAGFVLCRRNGRPVKPSNLSSAWARFCRTHGLPVIRLHDLRHSFGTAIFEEGGPEALAVAQRLLRHADPAITLQTYVHSTPRKVGDAVAAQERRIAAARRSAEIGHSAGTGVVDLDAFRSEKTCKGL